MGFGCVLIGGDKIARWEYLEKPTEKINFKRRHLGRSGEVGGGGRGEWGVGQKTPPAINLMIFFHLHLRICSSLYMILKS